MPSVEEHPHGALCWADLSSTDVPAAAAFYSEVIGWVARPAAGPEADGYQIFLKGDQDVAALWRPYLPGPLTGWVPYFAVDDADSAAAAALRLGGEHLCPPYDVGGLGRTATIADPLGAVFNVWQPATFAGSAVTGEAATLHSAELIAPDPARVAPFYAEVVGRAPQASHPIGSPAEPGARPRWQLHLAVADHAAAARTALRLGGTVVDVRAADRSVALLDPEGSPFSVSELPGAPDPDGPPTDPDAR